jgi:hypothetical protein
VAAVVEEEPVSPPAPPIPEPEPVVEPEPEPVVEETPEPVADENPEPVEEPAKVIKVGGYIATPHGWRPVH